MKGSSRNEAASPLAKSLFTLFSSLLLCIILTLPALPAFAASSVTVSTAEELKAAVSAAKKDVSIFLGADIASEEQIVLSAPSEKRKISVNLDGHTLSGVQLKQGAFSFSQGSVANLSLLPAKSVSVTLAEDVIGSSVSVDQNAKGKAVSYAVKGGLTPPIQHSCRLICGKMDSQLCEPITKP